MKFFKSLTLQRSVFLAVLIALIIVAGEFLTIGTGMWQIGPAFIVNTVTGAVGGPLWTAIAMAIADAIGALFFGKYGFFPGYTLSAFLVGIIYGLFFFRKRLSIERRQDWVYVSVAVIVIMLVDTVFFTSLWVSMTYKLPFKVAILQRLPLLLQIPLRVIVIMLVLPALQRIPQARKFFGLEKKV